MSRKIEFRNVPCYETHPLAKSILTSMENVAKQESRTMFLTDEEYAGVVTMAAHVFAESLIRMMQQTNYPSAMTAMNTLGEMIGTLLNSAFLKYQPTIIKARGGVPGWRNQNSQL